MATTDFLGNAKKALNYATELAALSKDKVMILYASRIHDSNIAIIRN